MTYNNDNSTPVLYLNCNFTGTLTGSYSGRHIKADNLLYNNYYIVREEDIDIESSMLYIYNQARNDFIEFLDVGKVVVMQGPRGRDGNVSFKDLTPKQINMLKSGPKGDNGPQGIQGPRGLQGIRGEQGIQGEKGDTGESNYDLWLENGNTGTLSDFLEASRGLRGLPGDANFQDITQEQLNGFVLGAFMKKRISNECFIKNTTPNIVFMRGFGKDSSTKMEKLF